MCSGYYSYDEGHRPEFAGEGDFAGQIVHPQFWPQGLDYAGKRVVVIGSGATAVTLVPEMAKTAAHVTMLQRSPTYVVSRPGNDAVADTLRKYLPAKLAYSLIRFKNVGWGMYFYRMTRKQPAKVRDLLIGGVTQELGPDYDVATHFTPRYNPWDQRLCLIPDADLFGAIKSGAASVVTDQIERFTPTGIELKSGGHVPADVIVTATGLKLIALGGMTVTVDGQAINPGQCIAYKGMMFSERAQPRADARLYQRVVDAAVGPDRRLCRAHPQPHDRDRNEPSPPRCRAPTSCPNGSRSTCRRAMSSVPPTRCRNRATGGRGRSPPTTRSTRWNCASARSTTASCVSPKPERRPRPSPSGCARLRNNGSGRRRSLPTRRCRRCATWRGASLPPRLAAAAPKDRYIRSA